MDKSRLTKEQIAKVKETKRKKKKSDGREVSSEGNKEVKAPFSAVEVFVKPKQMQSLFMTFRSSEVGCDLVRPRMLTESVEHGRGRGIVRGFVFRKFKEQPKAVFLSPFRRV